MTVAALFVRRSSFYKSMAGVECFDADRDARTFDLSCPVVAHPPCRAWSKLRGLAKPRRDERDLAVWALWVVRHCGGVLEHPLASGLWRFFGIERGRRDVFGGLLVPVQQSQYGHRAEKWTGLYCVGADFVPELAPVPGVVCVERMGSAERERSPEPFARLCVSIAESV